MGFMNHYDFPERKKRMIEGISKLFLLIDKHEKVLIEKYVLEDLNELELNICRTIQKM